MKKISEDIMKHYQDLLISLGMNEERVNSYTSIEEFKVALDMQKELNSLKSAQSKENSDPKKSKIGPVDMSKENTAAFVDDIRHYLNEYTFDERQIEDERFKKDNACVIDALVPGESLILRGKEGRLA